MRKIPCSITYSMIYMKPSRGTRGQKRPCFAADDLILFISSRQDFLDFAFSLNRRMSLKITVSKNEYFTEFHFFHGKFFLQNLAVPGYRETCPRVPRDFSKQKLTWILHFWKHLIKLRLFEVFKTHT